MTDGAVNDAAGGPGAVARAAVQELADAGLLDRVVERAGMGELALTGEGGFLPEMVRAVLERGLAAELTGHLGYEKGDPAGRGSPNSRNGSSPKTVATEVGPVPLAVPRDRDGSFEPRLVPKGARRAGGLDEMIISLYAGGMTVRDIQHHLARTIGTELSHDTISNITDAVAEEVKAWQARPLEEPWFPANVANYGVACWWSHRRMSWRGVLSLRQYRGRSLSSAATRASCSAVQICRSVPLGKYW